MTALQLIALLQTKLEENGGEDFEILDADLNQVEVSGLLETTSEQCEELGCDENFVYVAISSEL